MSLSALKSLRVFGPALDLEVKLPPIKKIAKVTVLGLGSNACKHSNEGRELYNSTVTVIKVT